MRKRLLIACALVAFATTAQADSFCRRFDGGECFTGEPGVINFYVQEEDIPKVMRGRKGDRFAMERYHDLRAFIHLGGTYETLLLWHVPMERWPIITALADESPSSPPREKKRPPPTIVVESR